MQFYKTYDKQVSMARKTRLASSEELIVESRLLIYVQDVVATFSAVPCSHIREGSINIQHTLLRYGNSQERSRKMANVQLISLLSHWLLIILSNNKVTNLFVYFGPNSFEE